MDPPKDPCTVCTGGTAFNPNAIYKDSSTCQQFSLVVNRTSVDTTQCHQTQLQAYKSCGCSTYPQDVFCSMCADGTMTLANANVPIPTRGSVTCGESLFAERSVDFACDDIQDAAYFCGCPGAQSSCPICEASGPFNNQGRVVPFTQGQTCLQLSQTASLLPSSECSKLQKFPFDMSAYCGCTGAATPNQCSLCESTQQLVNAALTVAVGGESNTCQYFYDLAPFVIDSEYCTGLSKTLMGSCCGTAVNGGGDAPTFGPATNGSPPPTPNSAAAAVTAVSSSPSLLAAGWVVAWWLLFRRLVSFSN